MNKQNFLKISLLLSLFPLFFAICKAKPIRNAFIGSVKTGNISELLHSVQNYPSKKPALKTYYEDTYEKTTPNWKFPVTRNLEEYLAPFSKCLIHITNSQNVNIKLHSTIPILIRYQIPTKVIVVRRYSREETLIWAPKGINASGSLLKQSYEFDCPFSTYTKDSTYNNGLCSSIDKSHFAVNIRPYNCEVIVALFPPVYMFEGNFYPPSEWRNILSINLLFPRVWNPFLVYDDYYDSHFESNVFNIWILDELYEKIRICEKPSNGTT
ncbi:unnamed protein product [Orchesella dallaii]|uniref:Lipoprotein n=1 Tax=Orchesella dallaii TaxID=48710 RepID=A0ABP1QCJ7_9HEXA